jgi:RES domain-containing protein
VILWRLCRAIYADLSGVGGLRGQGRWNLTGHRVVYTSATLSLSVLERRVHTRVRPRDEIAMQIELPESCVEFVTGLTPACRTDTNYTRSLGTEWLVSRRSLALAVPSVLVPELNYLLNPLHSDIHRATIVSVEPYEYDLRLFE